MALLKYKDGNEWKVISQVAIADNETIYQGLYTITPKTYEEQELKTKNKTLLQNIEVEKIPQYLVSNDTGKTLIIGDEYYN